MAIAKTKRVALGKTAAGAVETAAPAAVKDAAKGAPKEAKEAPKALASQAPVAKNARRANGIASPLAEPAAKLDTRTDTQKPAKKAKVVRDSFTMPKSEYDVIDQIKQKCLAQGVPVRKSELLRAGVAQLAALPIKKLIAVVGALEAVKTGRPKAK
jgi:hypothetical protein